MPSECLNNADRQDLNRDDGDMLMLMMTTLKSQM